MSETVKAAYDMLEKKIIALGSQKNELKVALQEEKDRNAALQADMAAYKQTVEQENSRLVADNALLSEKLNKLISRVESMQQNM
ncbi:hypothetical protein WMO13_08370 [Ignatzschineria larvae DSM 13226]|uniref:Cell division protein ZapB n=1 Tax=Ignatzschineria larvae DSM 13226 TaxID=1111732 RepID=A0ABZ3BXX6_9GAMM|nr:hypothetical protein [Ignatzschineria larvae]